MTTAHAPEPSREGVADRDGPAVAAVPRDPGHDARPIIRSADPASPPYGSLDMTTMHASELSGEGVADRDGPAVAALAPTVSPDPEYHARRSVRSAAAVRPTEPLA
jgi:hypothetical protein